MFSGWDSFQTAFWVCAIAGTVLFVLKTVLMMFAGMDHGFDVDGDAHDISHAEADGAFQMFSVNSITGFFMMFGWVGLACYDQFELGAGVSLFVAFGAGVFTMFVTAALFRGAMALISPGLEFKIENTIGRIGSVYQRIPGDGRGRIQISIDGGTREIDAVSEALEDIDSHSNIEVVRTIDHRTVSVKVVK